MSNLSKNIVDDAAAQVRYYARRMEALLASGVSASDKRYIRLKAELDAARAAAKAEGELAPA